MKKPEIIFDRKQTASFGKIGDAMNSPEQLVQRREATLILIATMCKADCVEYQDNDKSERYIITKKTRKFVLDICGNHFDGGWLNVYEIKD